MAPLWYSGLIRKELGVKVCFVPTPETSMKDYAGLHSLVDHLEERNVEVVGPEAADAANGVVAELTYGYAAAKSAYRAAQELGKPVLALYDHLAAPTLAPADSPKEPAPELWIVRYNAPYIAKVAIDVFLEAHLGQRVAGLGGSAADTY